MSSRLYIAEGTLSVVRASMEIVLVPFDAPDGGTGELTWGQAEIWPALEGRQRSMVVGGVMPLPEGSTVDETTGVLAFSMRRHQALRTTFRFDADGRLRQQVVARSGELRLEIVDAIDDPAVTAAEIFERYETAVYDYRVEWPLRMALVRHGGALTHAVAVYCHLVIDLHGLEALGRDLSNLDRGTGRELAPATGAQPLDLAGWQGGPRGRRQSDTAMRHWERQLRSIPARRFRPFDGSEPTGPTGPTEPRPPVGPHEPGLSIMELRSPGLDLALRAYAAASRADTSTVLLAALAVVLTRLTGINPAVVCEVSSNRFRPGLAESVSVLNQNGICVIDVADAGFDEVVARSWRASMAARLNAYYDPRELRRLIDEVGRDRREEVDLSCFFNDQRRDRTAGAGDTALIVDEILATLPRTTLRSRYVDEVPHESFFLNVSDANATLTLTLYTDRLVLSHSDREDLLRGIEALVVEAAVGAGVHQRKGLSL
jgi:hypothetical protein